LTFAISSPDEFLLSYAANKQANEHRTKHYSANLWRR